MNDAELDSRLRTMADDSLTHRAATVDTEAQFAEFSATLAGETGTRQRAGRSPRRWMLAVASLLVVAGLGAVAVLTMRPNDETTKGDADAATTAVPTSPPVPAGTLPPVTPTGATATPTVVRAGQSVTITPDRTIERACGDVVTATRSGGPTPRVGQIVDGRWVTPTDGATVTYLACVGETSDEAFSVVVPIEVPAGSYELCLTMPGDPAGCARVTITSAAASTPDCLSEPVAPPTMVDGTAPGEPDIETTGPNRIARWTHNHSQFAVSQVLDQARDPSVLDAAIADGTAFVNGTVQAVAIPVGDLPLGPTTIYVRDTADGCLRAYGVGPGLDETDAQAVAARWVNALAATSGHTGPATVPTSLRYDVGAVSVLIPIEGFPHPNQIQPSDLTVANRHWVIPGCCTLGVGIQNVIPLLRPEDRYKQQTIDEQDWSFYEIGPLDGSTLTATTNLADGTSILVGVQMFNSSTEEVSAALDAAVASIQVAPTSD